MNLVPNKIHNKTEKHQKDALGLEALKHELLEAERVTRLINVNTWQLIWGWLSSEEKCNLRLVSSAFKHMVDENLGLEVIVDNKSLTSNGLANIPPMGHLTLQDWVQPIDMDQVILRPHLVKSMLLDGAISINAWSKVLSMCPMLEVFKILPGFTTDTIPLRDGQEATELPNLRELLFPNAFRKDHYEQNICWKIIENFLVYYSMPKLEKLMIRLFFKCQTDYESSIEVIHNFLNLHAKTLKHLELVLRKGSACSHPHVMDVVENSVLTKLGLEETFTTSLQLKNFIGNCDSPSHEILDKIILHQDSLEYFQYDKVRAQWDFYKATIQQNQHTLRVIIIRYAAPIIDLSALENCKNLKQLHLGADQQMMKNEVNITNFEKLPTSLCYLQIIKYSVDSNDLASIDRLVNLNSLELEFLCSNECPNTGITAEVVQHIFGLTKLVIIYLEEFEKPHTTLKSIDPDVRAINMIKGDYITTRLGCLRYGVAIAPPDVFVKWDSRVKKYNDSHRLVLY